MRKFIVIASAIIGLHACTPQQQTAVKTVNYKGYQVQPATKQDDAMLLILKPYSDSIKSTMNKVIGFSTRGLTKKQPESDLGNFMADCMKEMAEKKFQRKVDAAFVNYGGIRSYIPKGDVTVGKIYELMPFDNLIVLQEVKGNVLKQFLAKVAERGGWPCSGISMQLKNKQAQNVLVNGKPIDDEAIYVIANSDYIANGGDDCVMLKELPQINRGFIFRDAIIEFVQTVTQQGKPLDWKTDGRVTY